MSRGRVRGWGAVGLMVVGLIRAGPGLAATGSAAFSDVTTAAGIHFVHLEGAVPLSLPQSMGPGVCFTDLDGDGSPDLIFVQGQGNPEAGSPPRSRFYRNCGDGTFRDETEASGLDLSGWGMGILATDLDGDGNPDLVATYYGRSPRAFRNCGDGTFAPYPLPELTGGSPIWNTGLAALDADGDGLPDVYVLGYVDFPRASVTQASPAVAVRGNLSPKGLSPFPWIAQRSVFLKNSRGRLTPEERGLAGAGRKSLSAVAFDADSDGRPDLFVAADVTPCSLYQNRPGGFADVSTAAWVADVAGSMGLAIADVNHDGALDLFCARWVQEFHALYHNNARPDAKAPLALLSGRRPSFTDIADLSGLTRLGTNQVGWGCAFLDTDHDGWDDLFIVNGHTALDPGGRSLAPLVPVLMHGTSSGLFERVTPTGPEDPLAVPLVGRGAAFADFDRDGTTDIAIACNRSSAHLLHGKAGPGHWLSVELSGTRANREALGARVVLSAGELVQTKEVTSGGSYLSSSSHVLNFGLGQHTGARLSVRWPWGDVHEVGEVPVDRVVRIVQP